MKPRKYDHDKIAAMYKAGKLFSEIQQTTGCPAVQIPSIITEMNIPKRGSGGEFSGKNKLTEKEVRQIYRLRFRQEETVFAIAAKFNTTPTNVSTICLGQTWKKTFAKYAEKEKGQ